MEDQQGHKSTERQVEEKIDPQKARWAEIGILIFFMLYLCSFLGGVYQARHLSEYFTGNGFLIYALIVYTPLFIITLFVLRRIIRSRQ